MTFPSSSLQPRTERIATWWQTAADRAVRTLRPIQERLTRVLRRREIAADPSASTSPATTSSATPSAVSGLDQASPRTEPARVLSLVIAALVTVSSGMGLLLPDLYKDPASVTAMFRGLDAVTLGLGVPSLLASMQLARRGSLPGQLAWAGTLAYTLYTYVLYVFGLSFNAAFLLHAALAALAIYALGFVLSSVDTTEIARRVRARVPARIAAAVLGFLGLGLGGMWAYYAARFALTGRAPQESLLVQTPAGTHLSYAADLVLLVPAYLLAAAKLWRQAPWGYLLGGTLLTSGVLQQIGYLTELVAQARAGIPGAVAFDPQEPPIVAAYLIGAATLLASVRVREPAPRQEAPLASGDREG